MRVLVTGATTPLGHAVVNALASGDDCSLVLAVGHEPRLDRPWRSDVVYRCVDLTRGREVHDLICGDALEHSIDTVVHMAQHRAPRDRGRKVHAQNVTATRELLLRCTDHPTIHRFVHRSFAEVYALEHATSDLLDEEASLDFDPAAPQWLRDRVEADLMVCAHFGRPLQIAVLRCAEILAADSGSQLWDYLSSRVCLRPLGFDPMLNVLSLDDAIAAFGAAARSTHTGVFNIPGADTLPLSRAIAATVRLDVPVPGPLLAPAYGLRRWVAGFEFRYDLNLRRFHFGGVIDGARARRLLGYVPSHPVQWPRSWWRLLLERLGALHADANDLQQ
jgi:UDP-glucose 4-epimerase